MTRVKGTMKDRGHLPRKAVFYTVAVLLFVPHIVCLGAAKADESFIWLGQAMHKWSHPCLYAKRPRDPIPLDDWNP